MLLYDHAVDRVHILNETAVQIWHLCDGLHDRESILGEMAKWYPGADTEVLREDLERVINDFREKGLLVEDDG